MLDQPIMSWEGHEGVFIRFEHFSDAPNVSLWIEHTKAHVLTGQAISGHEMGLTRLFHAQRGHDDGSTEVYSVPSICPEKFVTRGSLLHELGKLLYIQRIHCCTSICIRSKRRHALHRAAPRKQVREHSTKSQQTWCGLSRG
jgi:hypothetical protein